MTTKLKYTRELVIFEKKKTLKKYVFTHIHTHDVIPVFRPLFERRYWVYNFRFSIALYWFSFRQYEIFDKVLVAAVTTAAHKYIKAVGIYFKYG